MNTGTARIDASTSPRRRDASLTPTRRELWRQPLLMWALVLAAAMLSFYVHLLNDHVNRSEAQRTAQRAQQSSASAFGTHAQRVSAQTMRVAQTAPR